MKSLIIKKIQGIITRFKKLDGDPHFIAMGMGAGVFACATPTLPFQTFIALTVAFILRASKAASIIGSLIVAPLIPVFYLGSFKIGMLFLNDESCIKTDSQSITDLLQNGLHVLGAIMAGGIIIGIIAGICAYYITLKIFIIIRSKQNS